MVVFASPLLVMRVCACVPIFVIFTKHVRFSQSTFNAE